MNFGHYCYSLSALIFVAEVELLNSPYLNIITVAYNMSQWVPETAPGVRDLVDLLYCGG